MSYRPSIEEARKGFRGWHERGYLPHFDAPGVTQIVTFMLADSFPAQRRKEWEPLLREPSYSLRRRKLEAWLDRGYGECWLRQQRVAELVQSEIVSGHEKTYRLEAWVIMPNHVHAVVEVWETPLSVLLQTWKGRTARAANLLLARRGAFWQNEYFDTVIRDEAHRRKAIRYVEQNPAKAAFVKDAAAWEWSSAARRDEHGKLPSN